MPTSWASCPRQSITPVTAQRDRITYATTQKCKAGGLIARQAQALDRNVAAPSGEAHAVAVLVDDGEAAMHWCEAYMSWL